MLRFPIKSLVITLDIKTYNEASVNPNTKPIIKLNQ